MKRKGRLPSIDRSEWSETLEEIDEKIYSSFIAKRFRRFINWLYSLLINGFFGKLFTAYSAEDELFMNSRFMRALRSGNRLRRLADRVKLRMARLFEGSRLLSSFNGLFSSLIHRSLRTYGAFFLAFGVYCLLSFLAKGYVLFREVDGVADYVVCGGILLTSVPLLMTKGTLADAVMKSFLMQRLLFEGFGIPRDTFTRVETYPKRYAEVSVAGIVLGILTAFVKPTYFVVLFFVLIVGLLIFSFPEIGILALIALVPFSSLLARPSLAILVVLAVTLVSYSIKLMRGKRVLKLRLIDFSILLFTIIRLLGGLVSAGGVASLKSALLYTALTLGYFLVANLIRTREWVNRCVLTFVIFGCAAAVIGLVQIFTGTLEASWLDTAQFADIGTRITATFDNPNVFATYLLLLIPFSLALLLRGGSFRRVMLCVIAFALLALCMVETWSRGAWLGILVAILLFFPIYSRRSVPYLLLGGASVPYLSLLLPNSVVTRFLSIGGAADSSATYRISAWNGVARMLREHWLGGIGVGEAAFSAVYPVFSYAGIQGIRHTHNLYLQIMSEVGVAGAIAFIFVIVLFVQMCFGYIYRMRNEAETSTVIAGLVAVIGVLIMGLTDYVWYSYRVFLMFWMVIGLVSAYIRIGEDQMTRFAFVEKNTDFAVDFDLNVDNL